MKYFFMIGIVLASISAIGKFVIYSQTGDDGTLAMGVIFISMTIFHICGFIISRDMEKYR